MPGCPDAAARATPGRSINRAGSDTTCSAGMEQPDWRNARPRRRVPPYLDCDLIQFLIGIPGEIQSHDGVPRGLMRHTMRGIVPNAIIDRSSKGEFTQLTNQSIEHDFAAISEILGPSALSVRLGYVDGPVLWKLLPQWREAIRRADDAVLTNRVVDLCGFELLLRAYFPGPEARASGSRAIMATC